MSSMRTYTRVRNLLSDKLQDYWRYSRKYEQFLTASDLVHDLLDKEHEVSEETQEALRQLEKERVAYQNKIGSLNLQLCAECESCQDVCCDKTPDRYFTPIDYWLAKYSEGNTQSFASPKPFLLRYYLADRFSDLLEKFSPDREAEAPQRCSHLGENGCDLSYSERPIKCVIYACARMKNSLDARTTAAYTEAIRGLHDISMKTFDLAKGEAGRPAHYGCVKLARLPK
jgi:Fe-S-cluster containining protein